MSTVPGTRQGAVLPVRLVSTDRIEWTLAVSSSASSRHISSACTIINQKRQTKKMKSYSAWRLIYLCSVTLQSILVRIDDAKTEYRVYNMVDNIEENRLSYLNLVLTSPMDSRAEEVAWCDDSTATFWRHSSIFPSANILPHWSSGRIVLECVIGVVAE